MRTEPLVTPPVAALPPPGGRFFGLLGLLLVAGCAAYAALVLQTATGPAAVALRHTYPYEWLGRAYTAADYESLRWVLRGLAAGAAALGGWLASTRPGRAELRTLSGEAARAVRGLLAGWRALSPVQRGWALASLLALTALRGYYSAVLQPYDDATSYELFVREPLLTVSAVYALPNNHVLSNTLAWIFYQVYPGFWWSMRLPVLLTSTAATALWFLALLRRSSFGVALRAVGWFGLLMLSLYYAATGRGYWLLVGLGGVGFFAVLELHAALAGGATQAPPLSPRAAWVALGLSGVLGLYTVPTHALFLASAYGWLSLQAVQARAGQRLGHLLALAGLTLLGAGLLYAPLLLLSGPGLLLHNPYVQTLTATAFWRTLPDALRVPHHLLNLPLVLVVLVGFGWLWKRQRVGRLPAGLARLATQLGGPSSWFFLLPYGLAVVLLVQPPERTLFYKAQYLLILASLLVEWARAARPGRRARQWGRAALASGTLLLAASQFWQLQRQERLWQQSWRWQLGAPAARWLAAQPAGPVLAPVGYHCLVLRFYAHRAHAGRPWQIDSTPRPGVRYRYVVQAPGVPGAAPKPAFQNALLAVWQIRK